MPDFINLIVAVSFGLFVPIRILRSAKYRGLNLHASLLPDLRGPAPIQHSIIAGRSHTGVTLQTLDEQSFDKGLILDQTPRPGIPITDTADTAALTSTLATHAADMLVRALRSGLHLPPLRAVPCPDSTLSLVHATKLTKADRRVDLSDPCLTAVDVLRRARALGPLWIEIASPAATANPVRLILDGIAEAECPQSDDCQPRLIACHPPSTRGGASRLARAYVCTGSRGHVIFALLAGGFISVGKVTVPGQQACTAAKALAPYLVLDEVRSRRAPLVNVSD